VVYRADEAASLMINEEDHVRIQVLLPRRQIGEALSMAVALDEALGAPLRFAYDARLGFLTACPSNAGTGLRVSVMLHLPGLALVGRIQPMMQAARKLRLGVRGMLGEGTEAVGNLFQVSNESTLGESEEQVRQRVEAIVGRFVDEERNARACLACHERVRLCDYVARAHAVLRESYILSSKEALNSLSAVRLGIEMGLVRRLPLATVNRLALAVLPGHLQVGCGAALDPGDRDVVRAERVRAEFRAAEV
jgi:protein arginine kinase